MFLDLISYSICSVQIQLLMYRLTVLKGQEQRTDNVFFSEYLLIFLLPAKTRGSVSCHISQHGWNAAGRATKYCQVFCSIVCSKHERATATVSS